MNVHCISCRGKALLEVSLSLRPEGRQVNALCKTYSGAETNILAKSLYQQLSPGTLDLAHSTMRLSAYGGIDIPNLGSCQIYVKGPKNPSPKPIQVEGVDVDGPAIIGSMSAQNLNLPKAQGANHRQPVYRRSDQPQPCTRSSSNPEHKVHPCSAYS